LGFEDSGLKPNKNHNTVILLLRLRNVLP